MNTSIYQWGERPTGLVLRIDIASRPSKAERKSNLALPTLAPSARLASLYRKGELSFQKFSAAYRSEMSRPNPRQIISLLALLSARTPIQLVCFCQSSSHCHCSILQTLIESAQEDFLFTANDDRYTYASPVCYQEEF